MPRSVDSPIPATRHPVWPWLGWLALLAVALTVYWPALHGAMLWDDDAHMTRPELRGWFGLARIWFEPGATQQYYPVMHSAFWLQHRLWGDGTTGYHVVSLLLHLGSAGLIAVVMRRLRLAGAGFAAALFALHPVSVESVAWISELKNTLSTFFYLLALLAWLRFDARGSDDAAPRNPWRWYALAALCFVAAALTKTVTVTLPAALLVIVWWRRGVVRWREVAPLLPWFAFAVAAGLTTAWVERHLVGATGAAFNLDLLDRAQLAGRIAWFYLGKLLWPADLVFIYPRWDATAIGWLPLLAALATLALLWAMRRHCRGPLAAALLFGGTLFPALGFFDVYPFQYSYVADHFQYLASIAIYIAAASGLAAAFRRLKPPVPRPREELAAGLLLLLGFLSWQQARHYRDNFALYRATLDQNPACWMAAYNLGLEHANHGEYAAAAPLYREALRLKPDYAEVHSNLGLALLNLGAPPREALVEFEAALRLKPALWQTRANLANVLLSTPGREHEALPHYWRAVIDQPAVGWLRLNLGYALQADPARRTAALRQFQIARALQPDYWEAEYSIAHVLLAWPGREREAIPHLEAVRRLNPDFAPARQLLEQLRAW
ncbi:MAG: tetratricopeptide repeat protein [Opitutaceae bacterium]|nr:tetratricopeptide repeat protein [Opitutaceae bacterium]